MTVDNICDSGLPMTTPLELFGPDFTQFVLPYQCAISTLTTKVHILRKGFTHLDRHCPIEHVSSRVKSPDSIVAKAQRLRCPLTVAHIRQNIRDIAGVRITCGLISDTYRVADLIGISPMSPCSRSKTTSRSRNPTATRVCTWQSRSRCS